MANFSVDPAVTAYYCTLFASSTVCWTAHCQPDCTIIGLTTSLCPAAAAAAAAASIISADGQDTLYVDRI